MFGIKRKKQPKQTQATSALWSKENYQRDKTNKRAINRYVKESSTMSSIMREITNELEKTIFVLSEQKNQKGDLREIGRTDEYHKNSQLNIITARDPLGVTFQEKVILWTKYYETNGAMIGLLDRGKELTVTTGKVRYVHAINPSWINTFPTDGYPYYNITFNNQSNMIVHKDNIVAVCNRDLERPFNQFWGRMQSQVDEMAIVEKSSQQIANLFNNKFIPDYLIQLIGGTQPQADRIKESWKSRFGGWLKRDTVDIIGLNAQSELKPVKMTENFKDAQVNEIRKFERDYLEKSYHVYRDIDKSNRSTAYIIATQFYNKEIIPSLNRIINMYNYQVMPEMFPGKKYILSFDAAIPEDKEQLIEIYKNAPHIATAKRWLDLAGKQLQEYEDGSMIAISSSTLLMSLETGQVKNTQGETFTVPTEKQLEFEKFIKAEKEQKKKKDLGIELSSIVDEEFSNEELYDDVVEEYVDLMQNLGTSELAALGISEMFNVENPEAIEFLSENLGRNIAYMSETYKNVLKTTIVSGVQDGLGVNEIVRNIIDANNNQYSNYNNPNNLRRIVRTETHNAFQETKLQSYSQSEVVPFKQWLTASDERVREWHSTMEGQTVKINEMFISGLGNEAMRPGDFAEAEENILCRCTMIPKFDNKKTLIDNQYIVMKTAELNKMENTLLPYEEKFAAAYEEAFKKQLEKITNRMEEM